MDEMILGVGSRTLERLDAALIEAESEGPASASETLVRIALAYCDFAADNLQLWRALFEHRMAPNKPIPEWAIDQQMEMFRHIHLPLAVLLPTRSAQQRSVTARSLFSAPPCNVKHGPRQQLDAAPI